MNDSNFGLKEIDQDGIKGVRFTGIKPCLDIRGMIYELMGMYQKVTGTILYKIRLS